MVKRNVLLNPGPATTTDTVKMAQIVPDICPREEEFGDKMYQLGIDLLGTVHADPAKYTTVLFCGSGTVNIDVCLNSLLPEDKKILIVNNGSVDDSRNIAEKMGVRIIDVEEKGYGTSLINGSKCANGKYVMRKKITFKYC